MVPRKQDDRPDEHRHHELGSKGQGPVESDGGCAEEAQVEGDALEGVTGAAQLEEAPIPGQIAHQLQQHERDCQLWLRRGR